MSIWVVRSGTGGEGRDDTEGGPGPLPPSKPQPFRIGRIEGGFKIVSAGPNGPAPPKFLEVRVGYDTRRGDPLKPGGPFQCVVRTHRCLGKGGIVA